MEIPGYQIEEKIGQGGMAQVYRAVQESLERTVAIKVLSPVFADAPEFTQRFLNEGRMLASVAHSNVITIHDIGVAGTVHYIAMEFVDGGDLRGRMRYGLEVGMAVDYLRTLASALEVAHRKEIVHRDLKPSNVLFRSDGTLLLSDFGIAKELNRESDLTVTGSAIGSPNYLSPEQARGMDVDARADIYSLGILFYEMLTGSKPFVGDSDFDTMMLHVSADVPALPDALSPFQAVIEKMSAKKADARYEDVGVAISALDAAFDDWQANFGDEALTRHANANVVSAPARVAHETRSKTPGAAGIAAAVVIVGALGWWLTGDEAGPVADPAPAEVSRQSVQVATDQNTNSSGEADATAQARESAASTVAAAEQSAQLPAESAAPVATPAAAPVPNKAARVRQLLDDANLAIEEYRLTTPVERNAAHYLERILELDPSNAEARETFQRIAVRYTQLAQSAMRKADWENVKRYVRRGLSIDPNNAELKAVAAQIPKATKPAAPVVAEAQQGQAGRGETAPAAPAPASNTQDYDSPSELFGRLKKLFGD